VGRGVSESLPALAPPPATAIPASGSVAALLLRLYHHLSSSDGDHGTAAGDLLRNAARDGAQRHLHAALSLAHCHLKAVAGEGEAASADFTAMDGARVAFIGDSCVALARHSACLPHTVLAEHVETSLQAMQHLLSSCVVPTVTAEHVEDVLRALGHLVALEGRAWQVDSIAALVAPLLDHMAALGEENGGARHALLAQLSGCLSAALGVTPRIQPLVLLSLISQRCMRHVCGKNEVSRALACTLLSDLLAAATVADHARAAAEDGEGCGVGYSEAVPEGAAAVLCVVFVPRLADLPPIAGTSYRALCLLQRLVSVGTSSPELPAEREPGQAGTDTADVARMGLAVFEVIASAVGKRGTAVTAMVEGLLLASGEDSQDECAQAAAAAIPLLLTPQREAAEGSGVGKEGGTRVGADGLLRGGAACELSLDVTGMLMRVVKIGGAAVKDSLQYRTAKECVRLLATHHAPAVMRVVLASDLLESTTPTSAARQRFALAAFVRAAGEGAALMEPLGE